MKCSGKIILIAIITGISFLNCSENKTIEQAKVQTDSVINRTGPLFEIKSLSDYKRICVFDPQDRNKILFEYILYNKTKKKPNLGKDKIYVATPVENVAVLSSLYIGCLNKLNLINSVKAIDNKNYISNSLIRKKTENGEIAEIMKSAQLDIENTLLIKPELIITYGSGNKNKDLDPRLVTAEIPVAISLDHLETTPLNRAKWIKFIAAFYEKEKLADSLIDITTRNYDSLRLIAALSKKQPLVITEIKQSEAWFVPGGNSFMAVLIKDAGAKYVFADRKQQGSLALSYEEVFLYGKDAEFWIQLSGWKTMDDCIKQDERNKQFKAYQLSNLYNNDALLNIEGGNAYWETGLISPDEILSDLIKIFHQENSIQQQLKYYRRLK